MAPEVFTKNMNEGHGRAADIWSVGCVVIEMASAKVSLISDCLLQSDWWNFSVLGLSMTQIIRSCSKWAWGKAPTPPTT